MKDRGQIGQTFGRLGGTPSASRLDPRLRDIAREFGKRAARLDFEAHCEKVGQTEKPNETDGGPT